MNEEDKKHALGDSTNAFSEQYLTGGVEFTGRVAEIEEIKKRIMGKIHRLGDSYSSRVKQKMSPATLEGQKDSSSPKTAEPVTQNQLYQNKLSEERRKLLDSAVSRVRAIEEFYLYTHEVFNETSHQVFEKHKEIEKVEDHYIIFQQFIAHIMKQFGESLVQIYQDSAAEFHKAANRKERQKLLETASAGVQAIGELCFYTYDVFNEVTRQAIEQLSRIQDEDQYRNIKQFTYHIISELANHLIQTRQDAVVEFHSVVRESLTSLVPQEPIVQRQNPTFRQELARKLPDNLPIEPKLELELAHTFVASFLADNLDLHEEIQDLCEQVARLKKANDDLHRLLQYTDMDKERGSEQPEGDVRPTTERSVGTRTKPNPRDVKVDENAPHTPSDLYLEKYQKETSPFLKAVVASVVYEYIATLYEQEIEHRREQNRQRVERKREADREGYNAYQRELYHKNKGKN